MTIAPSPEGFTVDRISRPMNRVSAGSDARVHSYMRSHAIRALPRITHLVIAPATIKHQIIIIYFRFALQVSLAKHIYNIFLLLLADICSNCLGSYYFYFLFPIFSFSWFIVPRKSTVHRYLQRNSPCFRCFRCFRFRIYTRIPEMRSIKNRKIIIIMFRARVWTQHF